MHWRFTDIAGILLNREKGKDYPTYCRISHLFTAGKADTRTNSTVTLTGLNGNDTLESFQFRLFIRPEDVTEPISILYRKRYSRVQKRHSFSAQVRREG